MREPEAEDINAELRAMDKQVRNQRDLRGFKETGELTHHLLTEVWSVAKFKPKDRDLMLEVMKALKLLHLPVYPRHLRNDQQASKKAKTPKIPKFR